MSARSSRLINSGILLAIAVLAVNAVRLVLPYRNAQAQSGTYTPYTVIRRETVVDAQGHSHAATLETRALRSDGGMLVRLGEPGKGQRLSQMASGNEATINDRAGLRSTLFRSNSGPAAWNQDPNSKCLNNFEGKPRTSAKQTVAGEELVGGYRSVKVVTPGATFWFALDHGCARVKSRMDFGDKGSSEMNLVALIPGEPDAALFAIPQSYSEVPPSALEPPSSNCGPDCQARAKNSSAAADRFYLANRPR